MGVERWFERGQSDLRREAKIRLDWSPFSVGAGLIRPRIRPRRATAPPAAPPLRHEAQMMVE